MNLHNGTFLFSSSDNLYFLDEFFLYNFIQYFELKEFQRVKKRVSLKLKIGSLKPTNDLCPTLMLGILYLITMNLHDRTYLEASGVMN